MTFWEMELGLARVPVPVPVRARATEVMAEMGPEGGKVVTAPKAVAVQVEEAGRTVEEEEVVAAMGRRRATGPQAARVKVRACAVRILVPL